MSTPTPGCGWTTREILTNLITQSAAQYLTVLPSNLKKRDRELCEAAFKDGMRTLQQHLIGMGVLAVVAEAEAREQQGGKTR